MRLLLPLPGSRSGIVSRPSADTTGGVEKSRYRGAVITQNKRKKLPFLEFSPNRCKAASDVTAGVTSLMIVQEAFDFSHNFEEP